jgi:hypothetical protein
MKKSDTSWWAIMRRSHSVYEQSSVHEIQGPIIQTPPLEKKMADHHP